jgi:hypothetical protein
MRGFGLYRDTYLTRRTPILVYTPGHVGSTALFWSLDQRDAFVLRVFKMNADRARIDRQSRPYLWAYDHIVHRIMRTHRPARIITVVRDPLSAMVSEYITQLKWIAGVPRGGAVLPLDQLLSMFNKEYFEQGRHLKRLSWFEREFKNSLGIDVYSRHFPTEQGYMRFQSGIYDILIVQIELNDETKDRVIGDFVEIPDLKIMHGNIGDEKIYGDNYKAFKKQLRVAPERLDEIYTSDYARHFYSRDAINAARARWGGT